MILQFCASAAILAALLSAFTGARADAPMAGLEGASPGERAAIEALCGSERSTIGRQMCVTNQMVGLARRARKPDLGVATVEQRTQIEKACGGNTIPAERFTCERAQLASAHLPVRDEPGGGPLRVDAVANASPLAPAGAPVRSGSPAPAGIPRGESITGFPTTFSLDKWRSERPRMPPARSGPPLPPSALYDQISPSVYIVVASDQPVELAERVARAQGSAVAVSERVLLTNCHVIAGRPQIRLTQKGQSGRATLIYADPAGDRCFLKSDEMPVHPIQGIRRFEDLHVGETVFSLGTPSGLELSFGEGLVSGLRQNEGVRLVQNSAPSWHGSSGGGLFDARGNLVGITTAGSTTVANLNFSIAAEDFWP
jgi:hypothetical protein